MKFHNRLSIKITFFFIGDFSLISESSDLARVVQHVLNILESYWDGLAVNYENKRMQRERLRYVWVKNLENPQMLGIEGASVVLTRAKSSRNSLSCRWTGRLANSSFFPLVLALSLSLFSFILLLRPLLCRYIVGWWQHRRINKTEPWNFAFSHPLGVIYSTKPTTEHFEWYGTTGDHLSTFGFVSTFQKNFTVKVSNF